MTADSLSITQMMTAFREALCGLIPAFESVGLPWKNEKAYDQWDDSAQAIFKSIVGSAIDYAVLEYPIQPLVQYDFHQSSYADLSYIADAAENGAFVGFETLDEPFDICLFCRLDSEGRVLDHYKKNFKDMKFCFVPVYKDGKSGPKLSIIEFRE